MSANPILPAGRGSRTLGLLQVFARVSALLFTLSITHAADARLRTVPYSPDTVYRIAGHVGYQVDVQFETTESFVGLAAGDIESLSFAARANHLFLKPKASRVATNLTIITTHRQYHIEYSATARRPDPTIDDIVYALRFEYPPQSPPPEAPADTLETRLADAKSSRHRNVDYWYCGHPALKPVAASDDGVHTRLRFATNAEFPAIFVTNDDGAESLLNFNIDAGDVVIHRVARRLILRRGRLSGCIVNKGFSGASKRLESGTVAEGVERSVREDKP